MSSPYQEFVRKAKERYEENKKKKLSPRGGIQFTSHARYKMSQYALSEQKVKGVLRNPRRTQKGIAPRTAAVMQPVSPKRIVGKPARLGGETWKQEIWVMYIKKKNKNIPGTLGETIRIISTWRYPGVSPKGNPIPDDIWQELTDGGILNEA